MPLSLIGVFEFVCTQGFRGSEERAKNCDKRSSRTLASWPTPTPSSPMRSTAFRTSSNAHCSPVPPPRGRSCLIRRRRRRSPPDADADADTSAAAPGRVRGGPALQTSTAVKGKHGAGSGAGRLQTRRSRRRLRHSPPPAIVDDPMRLAAPTLPSVRCGRL
jgi:hypothetical protein